MIVIDNLAFSYGATPVLRNISMTLAPGRIYGLLGENGVGKTTLLTLLCGLKKPALGTVRIEDRDPYKRGPSVLASLYYLPDEVAPQNMTASSWAQSKGVFWPDFSFENFSRIMSLFENDSKKKMNAMSSGQLKKTYIAFALSCGAKYLFLDEPTNGLDIPSKSQFRSAILQFTREDACIVISTHQVRDLEDIIDPIIILDRQDVLLNASLAEITDKLYFDYSNTKVDGALYGEVTPAGSIQVCVNTTGEESKVNIEALFNAVHSHKELIKGMFRR